MHKRKNKPYTPSYFMKRLKDSGYIIWKMFDNYGEHDSRYWTMLIEPEADAVWITCYLNKQEKGDYYFELDDGNRNIPRKLLLKTESVETIISRLVSFNIKGTGTSISENKNINNVDDAKSRQRTKETALENQETVHAS